MKTSVYVYTINHITLINIVTQFAVFNFKLECSDNTNKFPNVVKV